MEVMDFFFFKFNEVKKEIIQGAGLYITGSTCEKENPHVLVDTIENVWDTHKSANSNCF